MSFHPVHLANPLTEKTSVISRVAQLAKAWQPGCEKMEREWEHEEEMERLRKWRENEEMDTDSFSTFPHFLYISSSFSHSLSIFSQPGCQAATSCATLSLSNWLFFRRDIPSHVRNQTCHSKAMQWWMDLLIGRGNELETCPVRSWPIKTTYLLPVGFRISLRLVVRSNRSMAWDKDNLKKWYKSIPY